MSYDPSYRQPPRQERWPSATPAEGWPSHRDGDGYRDGEQAQSRYDGEQAQSRYGAARQGPVSAGYLPQADYQRSFGGSGDRGYPSSVAMDAWPPAGNGYGGTVSDAGADVDGDASDGWATDGYRDNGTGNGRGTDGYRDNGTGYGRGTNDYHGTGNGNGSADHDYGTGNGYGYPTGGYPGGGYGGISGGYGGINGYAGAPADYAGAVADYARTAADFAAGMNGYGEAGDGYAGADHGYGGAADGYTSARNGYAGTIEGYPGSAADFAGTADGFDGYGYAEGGYGRATGEFTSDVDGYGWNENGRGSFADDSAGPAGYLGDPGPGSYTEYNEAGYGDPGLTAPDAGVHPDSWQAEQDSRRAARQRGMMVGAVTVLLGTAVAIGISTLAAALWHAQASPVAALGGLFTERMPAALRTAVAQHLGGHGRTVVLLAVIAILAVATGVMARRATALGVAVIAAFTLFAAFAVITRPGSHLSDVTPAVVGGIAGVAALLWLVRASAPIAPWQHARGGGRRRAR